MKKVLLFASALLIVAGLSAQKSPYRAKLGTPSASAQLNNIDEASIVKTPSVVQSVTRPAYKATADVTIMSIGNAANAYGLYNGGRTAVWADHNLNTVIFSHRMLSNPGSGYIACDISKDGGNTFTVNNQIFNPTAGGTANARYPQGGIYNPTGNTNPDNAFVTIFAPTLDGSNGTAGSWGGYGAATTKLDGTGNSQIGWPSHGAYRQNVPDAMAINPVSGDIFVVDPSVIGGLGNQYVDTLVITRGIFNASTGAYDYEQSLLYAPVNTYGTSIADCRIAFAPDGMIGYIMTLSDNGMDPFATESSYYPILYKTTDGGVTWDDTPITVILGGPDGLPGVVNGLMNDEQWLAFWGDPVPARDEIIYTTAFTSDFAVDMFGNPVINVVIGVSGVHGSTPTPYSILSSGGFIASFNIFSQDGGQTWIAQKLGTNLKTFRGTWGDISEDNRSQITTTADGSKMFFSWLDTDFEGQVDNLQPDIYCVGWDVQNNTYTDANPATADTADATNVTFLSDGWLQAYMGTASYYAFVSGTGASTTYTIPFVYQEMDATDPAQPVQYKYIKDFHFMEPDFVLTDVKQPVNRGVEVSQNYPNPFSGTAKVEVKLDNTASVSVQISNLIGQVVYEIPSARMSAGSHTLLIDASTLKTGVYTYTVNVNGERFTHKMIVK